MVSAGWMVIGVELFSVAKNEEDDMFRATMLDSRNSDKIEFACPHKESFCIPRIKCSIKFVVYDREALRFQQSKEVVLIIIIPWSEYLLDLFFVVCGSFWMRCFRPDMDVRLLHVR